ncbi:MAG: hypothetical protein AB7G52_03255 [Arcobacter sp.]
MNPKILIETPFDLKKIEENTKYFDKNSYIRGNMEIEVLEYFAEDYKKMGNFLMPFRAYGDDAIREDMALTVLRGVIEIKDCKYREALFVVYLLDVFLDYYEESFEYEYIADYEILYNRIKHRLFMQQVYSWH